MKIRSSGTRCSAAVPTSRYVIGWHGSGEEVVVGLLVEGVEVERLWQGRTRRHRHGRTPPAGSGGQRRQLELPGVGRSRLPLGLVVRVVDVRVTPLLAPGLMLGQPD